MKSQYEKLVKSLVNLALPYKEQLQVFPDYLDYLDEIVSDFDDAFHLVPQLMDQNLISYEAVRDILHCHNLIELNYAQEEKMTDQSFEFDDAWMLVRKYAKDILLLIERDSDRG